MNNALMFSRASDEWSTPQDVYDALNAEFAFEWDVAASGANAKCSQYLTRADDALARSWRGRVCWLNPPYSQGRAFIAKAAAEAQQGCTVVALVPARTDTRWWHAHVWDATTHQPRAGVECRFLKGRLKFGGMTAGAPFPSVVIVFRPHVKGSA
jgi:site-specific DNA-methyltransferase (adenine-specific)